MDSNSDLSSLRSSKSAWFNLKYLLLFLNMILVYINSGLFFYLFTKDLRKVEQFNLKNYPNLRYTTQISSSDKTIDFIERATEDLDKEEFRNELSNEDYFKTSSINRKYKSLNEIVNMFNREANSLNEKPDGKQLKRIGLLEVIKNKKDNLNENNLNNELNQQSNENSTNFKKNKTLIKKYNDLINLNKQLSLIYLLLALNNLINFICLTKEKSHSFLLFLTLPSIFTILPLIITKFNFQINLWLFSIYISIAILTYVHVKRLKQSTSEQMPNLFHHQFVSLESSSNPTSTQQFLISANDSCKSSLQKSTKDKTNLISIEKKDDQLLTPALKRIMNLKSNFKNQTPPPSYDDL